MLLTTPRLEYANTSYRMNAKRMQINETVEPSRRKAMFHPAVNLHDGLLLALVAR